ncbi:MAG: AAA family ATPase [Pseudomonadota bacterium]
MTTLHEAAADEPSHMNESILALALGYAAAGKPVFPCVNDPGDLRRHKAPLTARGFKDATTDPLAITRWWKRWPTALIGIPTGSISGIVLLDLDVKKGKNGFAHVTDWETLSPCRARTGTGGVHLYFKDDGTIRNSSDDIALGVDTRGEGGYFIAPGSPGYEWIGECRDFSNLSPWPDAYRPKGARHKMNGARNPANGARSMPRLVVNNPPAWLRERKHTGTGLSNDPKDFLSTEEIAAAIDAIENAELGWDDWNVIGMAIWAATQGSDEGRVLFHRLSAKNAGKYVPDGAARIAKRATDSVDERWDHYRQSPPTQLSAGKLFWLADQENPSWRDALSREESAWADESAEATDDRQGETPAGADWPTTFEWIDPKSIPRRQWLYAPHYIRKYLSLTISAGAVGKSSLVIVEALAMASGKALLGVKPAPKRLGEKSAQPLRVWYWNGEDPSDELQRRVIAAATHYKLDWQADVAGRLSVNSGRELEIIIAEVRRNEVRLNRKLVDELVKRIRSKQIDVVIVDPFVSSHRVAENDNAAIQLVASTWARIAEEANCAVMLVHHSRKTNGEGATVEDGRGASALANAARSARSLNKMTVKEAANADVEERERWLYFRSDLGKPNMSKPPEAADWYRLVSIDLENHGGEVDWDQGDHVGVVARWAYPRADRPKVTPADVARAQAAIRSGGPWRKDQRAKPWVGEPIAAALGVELDHGQIKRMVVGIIEDWLKNGWLVEVEGKGPKRTLKAFVEAGEAPAPDGKPAAR